MRTPSTAPNLWTPARLLGLFLGLCVVAATLGHCAATATDLPRQAVDRKAPRAVAAEDKAAGVRTEPGAVAAAIRILGLYGSPEMYDPARRHELVERTAAAAVREQLQGQLDAAFALTARSLGVDDTGRSTSGMLVARAIPVGQRIVAYTPDRAVVAVWTTGLLGIAGASSRNPVQESWSTETVTLTWEGDAWHWLELQHQPGPAPVGSPQVPATSERIAAAHKDFAEVPHGN